MKVNDIQSNIPIEKPTLHRSVKPDKQVPSFKDTLATFLNDVNGTQQIASDAKIKLLTGEGIDVHQEMKKSEDSNLSFNMLVELRNKSIDGFQEIMRTNL